MNGFKLRVVDPKTVPVMTHETRLIRELIDLKQQLIKKVLPEYYDKRDLERINF